MAVALVREADSIVRCSGDMTILHYEEIYTQLAALTADGAIRLDLSAVGRIDTAIVQLLLAMQRYAPGTGLCNVPPAIAERLTLLGLDGRFTLEGAQQDSTPAAAGDAPLDTPAPESVAAAETAQ